MTFKQIVCAKKTGKLFLIFEFQNKMRCLWLIPCLVLINAVSSDDWYKNYIWSPSWPWSWWPIFPSIFSTTEISFLFIQRTILGGYYPNNPVNQYPHPNNQYPSGVQRPVYPGGSHGSHSTHTSQVTTSQVTNSHVSNSHQPGKFWMGS